MIAYLTEFALVALVAWAVLMAYHGRFWRADQRLGAGAGQADSWPAVAAVIPARNEAETVERAVKSLLAQDYPGRFSLVLVDDGSDDGTASIAQEAAGGADNFTILQAGSPPAGWSGKMWAVSRGLAHIGEAQYVLFSDADIEHDPANLRRLAAKAVGEKLDMVSLMVLLRCRSGWERLLIPAFVFFFQKLYPFPLVNDPSRREAAAAGGCMLVGRTALERSGGIEAIRGRLIDDCALAEIVKKKGPIWLGLTERTRSLRAYENLDDIWNMVARTAFAQLGYSYALLGGTVAVMAVLYLAPPLAALSGLAEGNSGKLAAGLAGWLLMGKAYGPTLALYRQPAWRACLLPLAAGLFTLMTVDSAWRHAQGRGGVWKGRGYPER